MGEEGKMFALDDQPDGEQGPNFEETAVNQVNVMNEQIAVKEGNEAKRKSWKTQREQLLSSFTPTRSNRYMNYFFLFSPIHMHTPMHPRVDACAHEGWGKK